MLAELHIENLAVIEQVSLRFESGFTVFTGETGAGKSIVIDAINLVLGQRVGKDLVRNGTQKAHVTALFAGISPQVEAVVSELGFESEEGSLILSREIFADGRTQARLMGRPITVTALKQLGELLLNIHGQHDNQMLLQTSKHLTMLDDYAGVQAELSAYQAAYQTFKSVSAKQRKLQLSQQEKQRQVEQLTRQIEDIEAISPTIGEDQTLERRLATMRSADQIRVALGTAYGLLSGDEQSTGAVDALRQTATLLESLVSATPQIKEMSEQAGSLQYELEELSVSMGRMLDTIDFSPAELEETEKRYYEIARLKKKYGEDLEQVLQALATAQQELSSLQQAEEQMEELSGQLDQAKKAVVATAADLTQARRRAGERFLTQTREALLFLDMPNVQMELQFEKGKYGPRGCDLLEILFSTNPGEPPRSIGKVASGGELSRMMLAVKSALSENDQIPTLIFDEVDVGVSGTSSQKIGLKLKQVAAHHQVICVTHSAQIAALSEHHFLIQKKTEADRTFTSVVSLSGSEKVREVARIMSTGEITPLLLANANAMVQAGEKGGT